MPVTKTLMVFTYPKFLEDAIEAFNASSKEKVELVRFTCYERGISKGIVMEQPYVTAFTVTIPFGVTTAFVVYLRSKNIYPFEEMIR